MNTLTLIKESWNKANGEPYTDSIGSDTWVSMFTNANYYIRVWSRMNDWFSLYDPLYEVSVISDTDTYDLNPDDVRKLTDEYGDKIRILHVDGVNHSDYILVPANQLQQNAHKKACAKVGNTLKFSKPFISTDVEIDGTLYVPKYGNATVLTNENSIIPVDDPNWLICMLAYEIRLLDILRKDTANALLDEADTYMDGMKADNATAQETALSQVDLSWIGG